MLGFIEGLSSVFYVMVVTLAVVGALVRFVATSFRGPRRGPSSGAPVRPTTDPVGSKPRIEARQVGAAVAIDAVSGDDDWSARPRLRDRALFPKMTPGRRLLVIGVFGLLAWGLVLFLLGSVLTAQLVLAGSFAGCAWLVISPASRTGLRDGVEELSIASERADLFIELVSQLRATWLGSTGEDRALAHRRYMEARSVLDEYLRGHRDELGSLSRMRVHYSRLPKSSSKKGAGA